MTRILESLDLTLDIKPISTNHLYNTIVRGRNSLRVKSQAYVEFKDKLKMLLSQQSKPIDDFIKKVQAFDEPLYMDVSYLVEIPWNNLITKNAEISKRSMDWDNSIKAFQDCLFEFMDMTDHLILKGDLELMAVPMDSGYSVTVEICVRGLSEKLDLWEFQ